MLGLNKVAKAIFGSSNDRYLKSLRPIVMRIAGLEDQISALTDDQLQAQTPKLKAELEAGKSLDDILPEAFATVREASKRVLGMRHFDVQMMCCIAAKSPKCAPAKARRWWRRWRSI